MKLFVLLGGRLKRGQQQEPWKSGYATLAAGSQSSLTYTVEGPFATVSPALNLNQWRHEMTAIWNLSRTWYFTGNTAYAQKAHDILLVWANTQTAFSGNESMPIWETMPTKYEYPTHSVTRNDCLHGQNLGPKP